MDYTRTKKFLNSVGIPFTEFVLTMPEATNVIYVRKVVMGQRNESTYRDLFKGDNGIPNGVFILFCGTKFREFVVY